MSPHSKRFADHPRPVRRTAVLVASAGAASLLVLAGCSSGSGSSSGAGSAAAPAGQAALTTAHNASLGTIVVNGQGWTLYRFDKDMNKPPMSHCTGQCAAVWPPEPASDAGHLKGVDAKLVGSVTRPDGSKQLTLNGWPLYRYAPDTKPGDTKGQGVQGTWFAATPSGGRAQAVSGAPSTPSGSGGNGY
ncbi:hypothetical protein [Streptomyces sp. ICBB 8177]|uniref:COG4315 family predicted lipoprotein n=1 Tax=Streptomyces sp. ICBB 8177 TaxID=563922 RepID=UPI000D67D11C|nr:hypothetical protein [Streptomyces sp. ICBB 8177]PWI43277.1 hypothetical protein CK485_14035 [Streptomyces sp. ICBB 8177]